MKKLIAITMHLVMVLGLFVSCEKEATFADDAQLQSYTLEPSANEGLDRPVESVIEGKDIYIRIPNSVDISHAVASFSSSSSQLVAYIGGVVQESGVTVVDLSKPVDYRFVSPTAVANYRVHALKSASILSFGVYAEDNEGLIFRDYVATIQKLSISLLLPVGVDVSQLKARITTTAGATVEVGAAVFVNGETPLDFSSPQVFELSDAESTVAEQFVVTVGQLTAPVWTQVILPDFISSQKIAQVALDIHPLTQQPYLLMRQGGSTDDTRKVALAGFDKSDNRWFSVGAESGFSASRTDLVNLAFASNGVPFVAYKDYSSGDGAQFATIQKFVDNAWQEVAPPQSSFSRVNYLSMALDAQDQPYLGYIFARAAAPYPNRTTYVESFANGKWTGNTFANSSTGTFARLTKGLDQHLYYATMDISAGNSVRKPSVYKLTNGSWVGVGNPLLGPANANSGNFYIDMDVAEDGQIYLVFQSNSPSYITYVMHWNGATWSQLGDGIAQTTNGSASRDNVAIKLHPNGTLYLAYGDVNNGVKVTTFNPEMGNWNPSEQLSTLNGDKFEMRISKEGIPYLATLIDDKVALFKFDIPGL